MSIPFRFFWLFDTLIYSLAFSTVLRFLYLYELVIPPSWRAWIDALGHSQDLPRQVREHVWIFGLMVPINILVMRELGGYRNLAVQSRSRVVLSSVLTPLLTTGLMALTLLAFVEPLETLLILVATAGLSMIGLCAYRLALWTLRLYRHRSGAYAKNVLLVGAYPAVHDLNIYLAKILSFNDYHVIGYLDLPGARAAPLAISKKNGDSSPLATPLVRLGSVEDLGRLLISNPIHEVVVLQSSAAGDWLTTIIHDCDYFQVTLRIVPAELLVGTVRDLQVLYRSERMRLPAVVLLPPHINSDAYFVKRMIDIAVSLTLLVLLSPLFALIALAIKLTTPHLPIFYPWRVVGYEGMPFTGYKFTTMCADADERKAELASRNEMSGPVFKIKDDPRVTPLGRFLRKYSLNELPQLWSVLKGDMSLVGPRPAGPHELSRYEFWHKRKLSIRPGITCLWQVRGRNKITNFDDWVRMDLEYIDRWSLWLDLRILMRTFLVVVAGTGS